MNKYGINNVRGGSYINIKLEETVKELNKFLNATNDKCLFVIKKVILCERMLV